MKKRKLRIVYIVSMISLSMLLILTKPMLKDINDQMRSAKGQTASQGVDGLDVAFILPLLCLIPLLESKNV